ncbi:Piso0_005577 [Millerozyma farinosa CBS 7064]|uniref:Small ribosomal subunit protein mS37 n=1 Tax=Pichia sorbitophila (strain ATCC MYA-4447 / BCRC 22081 / CBS 7064 / NBRC 10061 / NRRL Y-12695) TaxID=559304 RepID=G8XZD2_PICSO|nr:Piso0_005577 [Millerozyma farinosa CBS 7064]CCE87041.1 Piso0_005577 [Millerozyma farinosa CBS 7064]
MPYKKVQPNKKLPPLPRLKIRRPTVSKSTNECFVLMSSLLNCWAANGEGAQTCYNFEHDLKNCMETYKPKKETISSINYHASRLYPKLRGKVND